MSPSPLHVRILEANPLGSAGATGIGYVAVGLLSSYYSGNLKKGARDAARAAGLGLLGLGVYKLSTSLLEEYPGAVAENLKGGAELPPGAGGLRERVAGAIARVQEMLGGDPMQPPVGVETRSERGATEGPHLGTPRNALRVAGAIRSPLPGQSITVRLGETSYPIEGVLENQSDVARTGTVGARLMVAGEIRNVTGPTITVLPGQMRSVTIRLPYVHVGFTPYRSHSAALLFDGFNVAQVSYDIDRAFL